MKSIVISSDRSGGGKTTIALGIMKALKNRDFDVQGYKVGPDYIDPAFHSFITGKASRNLDIFLMGEEGIKAGFSRGKGNFGVVEGVMGLYDGKGITTDYSTFHVAKVLNLPVVLVISPKAQCTTVCAELKGIMDFRAVSVAGIILNNITESYYKLLKYAIEKICKIKVFGDVPKEEKLELKSRHLGLVQSSEIIDLDDKISICSGLIEKYVDMDMLIACFKEADSYADRFHMENRKLKIAVAYDKAFSFYYKENLELLEEAGEVYYFSPLKDKKVPEGMEFLYIGGGYPEVFIKELSENKSMLHSIKDSLICKVRCYAECGGLMYLTNSIDGIETVGFFSGNSSMSKKIAEFRICWYRDNK